MIKNIDPDFDYIIDKYKLKIDFNDDIYKELNLINYNEILKTEIKYRKDLRNLFTITMDSLNAKDFDDAYSLKYEDERWHLFVHIADVAYFVRKNSILDKEAFERGNSYYLGPWVIHMLPPVLSENFCSLKENEDRLTVTCEIKLDKYGNIVDYSIYRSIINVNKRIPYEIGNKILKEKNDPVYNFLHLSVKLKDILYLKRIEEGSLNFDFPDYILVFKDSYIIPFDIIRYERGDCERIIEEFMLCANKVIATYGSKLNNFLFRIHERPDSYSSRNKKIISNQRLTHKELNSILNEFKNTDKQFAIERMILKSLKRANYDNKNIGHFGLNFKKYTHFTSPIRRYADLITHRLIFKEKYSDDELKKISIMTSIKEQIAASAEEEYFKIKNAHFMKKYLNQSFEVSVTGIISKGVFCRIDRYGCEGLLAAKLLEEKGYLYNKKKQIYENKNNKKDISLGTKLNLILIKSDSKKGFIDFSFNKIGKRNKDEKIKKKRRNTGRHDTFN
ncbi:MAG: RNB domain-containing ribonuclease [Exilispira sp.]